jgi:CHAT domain-containing protein
MASLPAQLGSHNDFAFAFDPGIGGRGVLAGRLLEPADGQRFYGQHSAAALQCIRLNPVVNSHRQARSRLAVTIEVQLGGVNDGFLTVEEVTHLKLNADLVVLSACETGKGDLRPAEGVIGLSRAFLYAGSRGVVCSLRKVNDEGTSTLMQALYRHLKEGKPPAEALALAKRQLIAKKQAPYYWAPFILIGK